VGVGVLAVVGVVEGIVVRGAGTKWRAVVGERAAARETTPGVVFTGGRNHSAPQRLRS
jgi:hypothetical protein